VLHVRVICPDQITADVIDVFQAELLGRWQAAGGASVITKFVNAPGTTAADLRIWAEGPVFAVASAM
jgi:hypothetical protein